MTNPGPTPDWVSCPCTACSGNLDFRREQEGTLIECPHCLKPTVLYIPGAQMESSRSGSVPPLIGRHEIITTTGNEIAGQNIAAYLGVVRGVVVRSPDILQGVLGGLKSIVGGNIETYAEVCDETRQQAFDRMVLHARELNANAIIGFRYDATEFSAGITEVLAYGTAVRLKPVGQASQ
jgi:uncharacterized protein YbjQ (UPF0145 family)